MRREMLSPATPRIGTSYYLSKPPDSEDLPMIIIATIDVIDPGL
jgi:hypothetical protein